jgi:acetylglutamate kinase
VLVHGGGDEITQLQAALGITPQFIDGRRITTDADIDVVRMALSGTANKRLVSTLLTHGVRAVGLSGEDGALIEAVATDTARMGRVGTPVDVNAELLRLLLAAGYLPVVSPVSREQNNRGVGSSGEAESLAVGNSPTPALDGGSAVLNVNGDDAAAAIAIFLGATELLLVSDVEGVYHDSAIVRCIALDDIDRLLADPGVTGGMRAKLQASAIALRGGVERVRISDLVAIEDAERGTSLTPGATGR